MNLQAEDKLLITSSFTDRTTGKPCFMVIFGSVYLMLTPLFDWLYLNLSAYVCITVQGAGS